MRDIALKCCATLGCWQSHTGVDAILAQNTVPGITVCTMEQGPRVRLTAAAFRTIVYPCSGSSLVGASAGRNGGPAAAGQNARRPQPAGW